MTKRIGSWVAAIALVLATTVPVALAADTTAERFDNLKALAGDWTMSGGDGSVAVTYRVTAGGSAVVETLFPGAPHEMVTIYTVDNGDLVLTHYCAEGNQPHMKAVKGGDAGAIDFKFVGGGNMKSDKDGHMHEAVFTFEDKDHVKATWVYFKDGKAGENQEFTLVRLKS
jgi:hypothetical protein